jgi:hypothetical protein
MRFIADEAAKSFGMRLKKPLWSMIHSSSDLVKRCLASSAILTTLHEGA